MDIILENLNKKYKLRYVKEDFFEPAIGEIEVLEGIMDGFYISIQKEVLKEYGIKINVAKDIGWEKIGWLFENLKDSLMSLKETKFKKNYIKITVGNEENDIRKAIRIALSFLKREGARSTCAFCGANNTPISYAVLIREKSSGFHLCDACIKKTEFEWRKEKEEKDEIRGNVIMGLLGSLIGVLVAGIPWTLTWMIGIYGIVTVITALMIPIGAIYGFSKFGKKIDKFGMLLVCISTVIGIWFHRLLILSFMSKRNLLETILDTSLYKGIFVNGDMITIFIICLAIALIGVIIKSKELTGGYVVKKIEGEVLSTSSEFKEDIQDIRIPASLIDNFEMTEKDKQRMARNIEKIKLEGLPFHPTMPVSISESKAIIPNKETIIKRAAAMQMTGVVSELYNEFGENAQEHINQVLEMFDQKYGIKEILTDEEKEYLAKYTDDETVQTNFNWRYECPPVLLWALSLQELTDLNTICEFRKMIEYFLNNDLEKLMNESKLRSKDEIMDMLDYLYRLNWSAVEMRIHPENHNNKEFPYDESIIHFRRLALEWLVQPEKSIEDVEAEMHT